MLDSIHTARWAAQFEDERVEIFFYPSKRFRRLHPLIVELLGNRGNAKYTILETVGFHSIDGYIDYLRNESFIFQRTSRLNHLRKILLTSEFDFVHALEIQGAGYLLANIEDSLIKKNQVIVTNWGSDIFYYMEKKLHLDRIKKVLSIADYYSAECERDYDLAYRFGFSGVSLPCIPNAGGFNLDFESLFTELASTRNQIIVKGYGGNFGRVDLVIEAINLILSEYPNLKIYFYSVTPDILPQIIQLKRKYYEIINYSEVKNPLSQSQLYEIFAHSRIYVGCSASDGISTSFLEALAFGAYPIQSDTSCAQEWLDKGAIGTLVPLISTEIYKSIKIALENDELVDTAQKQNQIIANAHLKYAYVKSKSMEFYRL